MRNDFRIWIHAVSVGEVQAVAPIIERLLEQGAFSILMTTTTPTGAQEVSRLFGGRVDHTWIPIDTFFAVKRFYNHWQPDLVALVETEVWPNIILEAQRRRVPALLINARMSKRSAKRYSGLGCIFESVFAALTHVACQTRDDKRRLNALGVPKEALSVTGSCKFEIDPDKRRAIGTIIATELNLPSSSPIVVAGSLHTEEEKILFDAMAAVWTRHPQALLMVVPRHIKNTPAITAELERRHIPYVVRSQDGRIVIDKTRAVVVDTFGELGGIYSFATAAFIGGSLFDHGGHNPLEAIAMGVPVIAGPFTYNFSQIYRELAQLDCYHCVTNTRQLTAAIEQAISNADRRNKASKAGLGYFEANTGSATRQAALIERHINCVTAQYRN